MKTFLSVPRILFLAIVLRILLPAAAIGASGNYEQFIDRDTGSYIQPATALAYAGQFDRDGEPEILRTPGYPVFLIPGIVLGHVELVTISLQIVVSTLTVLLVYQIAFLLFKHRGIAIFSALLYALDPLSILYSSKLMSETLFTTLIALSLYLLLKYLTGGSAAYLLGSAVTFAASAYVRPISYYLPILVFLILLIWILIKKNREPRRLAYISVFLVISIGLIGIWQLRNSIETEYSGFSSAAEESIYYWDAAMVLADVQNISYQEMRDQMGYLDEEVYLQRFPEQLEWERSRRIISMGREGREIILNNMGTYVILAMKGAFSMLLDPAAGDFMRILRIEPHPDGLLAVITGKGPVDAIQSLFMRGALALWVVLVLRSIATMYIAFVVIGIAHSRISNSVQMMLVAGMTAYFIVLSAVGLGDSRARVPIMPILCVFAAYGAFALIERVTHIRSLRQNRLAPINRNLAQ